jgi:hypothetical protein
MKNYTTKQVAELRGVSERRICAMLKQDANPKRCKTHFPHAKRCECGKAWLIPSKDIK